jgi:ABC-type transport system involved in multi-copper enzyme maturation permease subunit
MTWLTWRQFRVQAVMAAAALAAFAVLLAATGPHLASVYATSGITGCADGSCTQLAGNFLSLAGAGIYPVVYMLGIVGIVLAPAIIGIFWGAPLIARELEAGTFRLAWTQSITRTRWLATKLALTGLSAMAVTEGLSLLQAWWAAPIDQAARLAIGSNFPLNMGPFSLLAFDAHGITPLGYAAFAFALGVTTGILLRRAIPAMAITLAIFAIVQIAFPLGIRPHLFAPDHMTIALGSLQNGRTNISETNGTFAVTAVGVPGQPGAWIISSGAVNAAGQPVGALPAACHLAPATAALPIPAASQSPVRCLTSHGIRIAVSYQPASRYWAFQGTETGSYLALALVLAGYCFWRVGRRLY